MKNLLQVHLNGEWKYVGCLLDTPEVVTTNDKKKALPGIAIEYFQRKMGNLEFRVSK